ncbi:DUF502 domain-containing protein [Amorphus orientalis]|uniref:Membrane protein n=1 Tax=Amorphus orientalis TaxID=649198 RepID=A0AAE3VP45_9HYPH|nr:DUF502 domain-containing protein [Amorphus orientalis]MDQ0315662.1 putative membrane protein [Amorphus orientalis]
MQKRSRGKGREPSPKQGNSLWARLRNYFLTGVVFAAPLTITVLLTWTFVKWVDAWVKPFIPARYNPDTYLSFPVPGIGLIVALVGLTLLGFLTANIFGRTVLSFGEQMLNRMPLVRNLYKALKQIFETALSERGRSFQQAGLIEYPRKGIWSIVFIATQAKGEVAHRLSNADDGADDEEYISVFLPTTPNPTSGFLLYLPESDVLPLDMSVEDAAKLVISAGLITPDYEVPAVRETTQQLALAAGVDVDGEAREEGGDDEPDQPARSSRTASSRSNR